MLPTTQQLLGQLPRQALMLCTLTPCLGITGMLSLQTQVGLPRYACRFTIIIITIIIIVVSIILITTIVVITTITTTATTTSQHARMRHVVGKINNTSSGFTMT